jgi:hypothetical protein
LQQATPLALDCLEQAGCNASQPQAATLIPGMVFVGSLDSYMCAYDTTTGKNTKKTYETVNGLPANGGSLNGARELRSLTVGSISRPATASAACQAMYCWPSGRRRKNNLQIFRKAPPP